MLPTISGRAWITGYSTYLLDSEDPFPDGFTVGDIWAPQTADTQASRSAEIKNL